MQPNPGPAGTQRLTPADVGRRVTVRRALPEGSAHRWADAVGVLESWSDGMLVVRRHDGSLVEVAETALAAGRVVPDRRPRAAGPAEADR